MHVIVVSESSEAKFNFNCNHHIRNSVVKDHLRSAISISEMIFLRHISSRPNVYYQGVDILRGQLLDCYNFYYTSFQSRK